MKVLVLGAGLIGTASAWYLAEAGHEVTVLERQPGAGLETSFANGGQISADHAAPWAKPGVPLQALKWMFREDAPLLFRLRADPAQWRWGLEFLRNCTAGRFKENAARLQQLGRYSRAQLRALRKETGLQYDQVSRGILAMGASPDVAEGIASFKEKRAPRFAMKASTDMPDFYPWWEDRPFK